MTYEVEVPTRPYTYSNQTKVVEVVADDFTVSKTSGYPDTVSFYNLLEGGDKTQYVAYFPRFIQITSKKGK